MDTELYNLQSFRISIIALAVTIIGLATVYYQIKKLRQATWSNLHSTLWMHSHEIIKLLKDHPNTYEYFYSNKKLEADVTDRIYILLIAEAFANFMEQLVLQLDSLPTEQRHVWGRFVESTLRTSKVVGDFIRDHREWYSPALLKVVDECTLKYNL